MFCEIASIGGRLQPVVPGRPLPDDPQLRQEGLRLRIERDHAGIGRRWDQTLRCRGKNFTLDLVVTSVLVVDCGPAIRARIPSIVIF